MNIARGLTAEGYDRDYEDRALVGRIAAYFAPHRRRLAVIVAMLLARSLFGAAVPLLVAQGVDRVADDGSPGLMALLVGVTLALGVAVWLANWVQRRLSARLIGDVVLAMRRDAFGAAVGLDMGFYDEFQSGSVVSRVTSDTDEFGRVAVLVFDVASQMLLAILLLVALFVIDWHLALVVLAVVPVALVIAFSFRSIARRVSREAARAATNVNVSIQEAVTGIGVAKNFRRERSIYNQFSGANEVSYHSNIRRGFVLSLLFPTLNTFGGIGTALILYFGARAALGGSISLGDLYLFSNSVGQFWFPLTNLAAFWSQFQAGLSATERVFALMDTEATVQQRTTEPVPALLGEIQFEGVRFGYKPGEWVLDGFNLHIRPGESVALVGHTGAGKSSIAKLVTRFYEFQEGHLLVDGRDIRCLDLQGYRRHLGIVSQVPFLFDGTVADNIRYARPEMSDAQVAQVAAQVGGDWLETLPNGLQSDVGERGSRLSLGQRQLVVLARVLAQEPAIFILDEATASIDPFTEAQIQTALERIFRERTSIIIAHRLSTVKAADRILVLERGHIIEEGNHDALMARGGHYAELYDTYFRHQSLDWIEGRRQANPGSEGLQPLGARVGR